MARREAVTSLYSEDTKPQQLQNVPNEFARREMIRTAAYTRQGDVCNIRKCRTAFPTRKLTLVQCAPKLTLASQLNLPKFYMRT